MRLLPRIVCVQVGEPFVVFLEVRGLQVFQAAASLIELRLQNAHIFLRKLQFQPRHFPAQVRLVDLPGFPANVQRKFAAFFLQREFAAFRVRSRECDRR